MNNTEEEIQQKLKEKILEGSSLYPDPQPTEQPKEIKIVVVGAGPKYLQEALASIRQMRQACSKMSVALVDIPKGIPAGSQIHLSYEVDREKMIQRVEKMIRDEMPLLPLDRVVQSPRNQRIPHRKRGDRRKYPH